MKTAFEDEPRNTSAALKGKDELERKAVPSIAANSVHAGIEEDGKAYHTFC